MWLTLWLVAHAAVGVLAAADLTTWDDGSDLESFVSVRGPSAGESIHIANADHPETGYSSAPNAGIQASTRTYQ